MKTHLKNKFRSLKRTWLNCVKKINHRRNFSADVLWLSLGENCLTDDILRRHQRKSYSHVFSSARSNIEYVLQMEKDNYRYLLQKEHLACCIEEGHDVLRSTRYIDCENIYSENHMKGFEFSHHNPLSVAEDHRAFKRRIARAIQTRGSKNIVFVYHHRINPRSNLTFIRDKLTTLIKLYTTSQVSCQVVLFYQQIDDENSVNRLTFYPHETGLLEFVCHTKALWGGENQNQFWAKNDDNLFVDMFNSVDAWRNEYLHH